MSVPTAEITNERLAEWATTLERNHCTPALLIGIGHDEHLGEVHVCVPEDTTPEMMLSWASAIQRNALEALSR